MSACDHTSIEPLASRDDIAREMELRREFFLSRLDGSSVGTLRDIVDMTIDAEAPIYLCACGVLVRPDPMRTPARFAADEYDLQTLEMLHALHVSTFASKTAFRDLLPSGARVLEVGSYVGGFLEAARRWGWRATGVDIGRETSAFARSKGYDVTSERLERCAFEDGSFGAVFIVSCFEQMVNPAEVLAKVHAITKPGAPLVIMTPDAAVYIEAERAFAAGEPRDDRRASVQRLAYNNLLGFPHRFGYTQTALERLVGCAGFTLMTAVRVPAIRPYRERLSALAREEESQVGPAWIEAVCRREK